MNILSRSIQLALLVALTAAGTVDACERPGDSAFDVLAMYEERELVKVWTIPKSEKQMARKFPDSSVPGVGLVFGAEVPRVQRLSLKDLPTCKELATADFSFSDVTDAHLAQISKCKRLRELVLDHTSISDAGLRHLSEMKQLHTLSIAETKVTDEGVASLKRALPMLEINRKPKPFKEPSESERALSAKKAEEVRRWFEQRMRKRLEEQAKRKRVEEED